MLTALKTRLFSDPEATASIILRTVSDNLHIYRARYGVAVIFMAITAGCTAAFAWLIRDAVNDIFVDQTLGMIWVIGGAMIGLSVVRGMATYISGLLLERIANNITFRLQGRLFDKMLRMGTAYYDSAKSSELLVKINNAVSAAGELMNTLVGSAGRDVLTLLALLAVMLMQDVLMTALTLLIAPLAIVGVNHLLRMMRELNSEEFAGMAEVIGTAQETSGGIRVIKSFGLEDAVRERSGKAIAGVEARRNAIARVLSLTSPLMESLGGMAVGVIIIYAGFQVIVGGQTPGEYMAFIAAFLLAYEPAKRLARLRLAIERCVVRLRMIYSFLDEAEETSDGPDATAPARVEGDVAFREVSFGYRGKGRAVKKVSLRADKGETVALVGPSGGGKSTIVSLLQRFYEPQAGEILLDGRDIRTITRQSLRGNLAYVSQDAFLFGGTVRLNLAAGRPEATEEEIVAAAQAANAWDFIGALPQGLDTEIGENGVMLSGGQRQRLTIARAILKDAPVLLLDEATSALDAESERQVQAGLDALMAGRTTLVIAHRLSTILRADRIYVLREGRVVEEGDHATLLAAGGLYAKLYRLHGFDQTSEVGDAAE